MNVKTLGNCILARQELLDALGLLRRAEAHVETALDALRENESVSESARNQLVLAHVAIKSQNAILDVIRTQIPREIGETR